MLYQNLRSIGSGLMVRSTSNSLDLLSSSILFFLPSSLFSPPSFPPIHFFFWLPPPYSPLFFLPSFLFSPTSFPSVCFFFCFPLTSHLSLLFLFLLFFTLPPLFPFFVFWLLLLILSPLPPPPPPQGTLCPSLFDFDF